MNENPYQAPRANIGSDTLPDFAVRKATNLVRDARLSIAVALIPLLGLIFILRLVQWYQLRKKFPILGSGDAGEHSELAKEFRSAKSSLWFAVLLWPGVFLFVYVYAVIYL